MLGTLDCVFVFEYYTCGLSLFSTLMPHVGSCTHALVLVLGVVPPDIYAPGLLVVYLLRVCVCRQDPIKAVEYIRDRRRGAINRKQLSYLDSYERRSRGNGCSSCVIM